MQGRILAACGRMMRPQYLHVAGRRFALTEHAIERWALRVRANPKMSASEVADDVRALAMHAEVRRDAPAWVSFEEDHSSCWLCIGDDIAMPVNSHGAICTVIARGTISEATRAKRKAYRKQRRHAKRVAVLHGDHPRPVRTDKPRLSRAVSQVAKP
ncbi:MAG: hypothetical protein KGL39_42235 [Patescibacteria group bacterium]|nr:hypothetical protein [Patescibacteria group bacterium]